MKLGANGLTEGKLSYINDLASKFSTERSDPWANHATWSEANSDYCLGSDSCLPPVNSQDSSQ